MPVKDVIIIGGGISGLSTLHFALKQNPNLNVTLYEAESRLGGTIGTDKINGYSFDWGPNGFLDREPLTLQLCAELELSDKLEKANANVSNRFILRKGKLRSVPSSPPKFLTSDILSFSVKLRVFFEPFIGKGDNSIDESVYDFVKRRIGRQAADYLVQPMVSGIYGGLADRLSLKSCFPIMTEMEQEYGSLFKAMISKAKAAKAKGKKSGGPAGPGGWLTSFDGGLYTIIEQFHSKYSQAIKISAPVESIYSNNDAYTVRFKDGHQEQATSVVLATPSNVAATLTSELSVSLSKALNEIDYAPISVVCLGFDLARVGRNLDGFGFLVPSKEKKSILGSIWTSSIFKDRAPYGKAQFRTMLGGDGDHQSIKLSDSEMLETCIKDLNSIVGLTGQPEISKIYRWQHGIPQFKIGHSERLSLIENELSKLGNIYVTGNAYYGIGLNDCVKQSYKVANQLKS